MFGKLKAAQNVTLGTGAQLLAHPDNLFTPLTFNLEPTRDPDDPAPVIDSLYTLRCLPWLPIKPVSSWDELMMHGGSILIVHADKENRDFTILTPRILAELRDADAFPVPVSLNLNSGSAVNGMLAKLPKTRRWSDLNAQVYAVITDATDGMVCFRWDTRDISSVNGITVLKNDPSHPPATEFVGWLGIRHQTDKLADVLRASIPKVYAGMSSKERRCFDLGLRDEIAHVGDQHLTRLIGVQFHGKSTSKIVGMEVGLLSLGEPFYSSSDGALPEAPPRVHVLGRTYQEPCAVYSGAVSSGYLDEVLCRILPGFATQQGNDLVTTPGIASSYVGSLTENLRDIMVKDTAIMTDGGLYTVDSATSGATNSPSAFVSYNSDGTSVTIPSAANAHVTTVDSAYVKGEPLFGAEFFLVQDSFRRAYARAENWAKRLYR